MIVDIPIGKGKTAGKVDAYGLNFGACLHQFFVVKSDIYIAVDVCGSILLLFSETLPFLIR